MAAPSCEGVYLIYSSDPLGKNVFKIGRSCDISRRMKEYGPTWGILCCHPHDDSVGLEAFIIKMFQKKMKIYANKEYFESPVSKTSISRFFLECIAFFNPSSPNKLSLARPEAPPDFGSKTLPEPVKKIVKKVVKKPVKKDYIMTPLHEIKIELLNPDYPNAWKKNKREFKGFVNKVRKQLREEDGVDMGYVKEKIYGFLEDLDISKTEMNKISRSVGKIDPRDLTPKVITELIE